MKVCGFVYLSNHCHIQIRPSSVQQMADFMRDVNYKISKEVGRLHHWEGGIWPRPYTDVQISDEPEAQIAALRYLLEQGSKEGLVASPKSPIPCWEHLKPHQYQARVRAMVREIEKGMEGVPVLGKRAICAQDPHDASTSRPRRTPAPRFRASEPQVRRALERSYRLFLSAY